MRFWEVLCLRFEKGNGKAALERLLDIEFPSASQSIGCIRRGLFCGLARSSFKLMSIEKQTFRVHVKSLTMLLGDSLNLLLRVKAKFEIL